MSNQPVCLYKLIAPRLRHNQLKPYDRSNKFIVLRYGLRKSHPKYRPRCILFRNGFYQTDAKGNTNRGNRLPRGPLKRELTDKFYEILKLIVIDELGEQKSKEQEKFIMNHTQQAVKSILKNEKEEHTFTVNVTKTNITKLNAMKIKEIKSRGKHMLRDDKNKEFKPYIRDERTTSLKAAFEENADFVIHYVPPAKDNSVPDLLRAFRKREYEAPPRLKREKAKVLPHTYQYENFPIWKKDL